MSNGRMERYAVAELEIKYEADADRMRMPVITNPDDVYKLMRDSWDGISHHETAKILLLNKANRVIGAKTIGVGGTEACVMDIKVILQTALLANASSVIVIHNHPSGSTKPSDADVKVTGRIKAACTAVDVKLLDHMIFTTESYLSLSNEDMM